MHIGTQEGDAQKAVESWLADQNSSRMALLADYGTGKTTFCQHLAATLAKKHLESSKNQRYGYRLPLLIPLLEFSKSPVDLSGFLVAYLKQRCKVDNPDFDALMKMAEAGLFLFILDGFDEMASRASTDTIRQNIALFDQLARLSKNKVLLTTRPEYFASLSQEQDVLRSYDRLYLQLFDGTQIDLYLQKRVPFIAHPGSNLEESWKNYRQQIDRIHDLSDLARRPVLLEMIIKTLPKLLNNREVINRPNLYQRYLEGELERQHFVKQRRDLQINMQKRFEIMGNLALELYRSSQAELSSRRILEISKELLTEEQHEELEGSLREIITCSFLIRRNDRYSFSHQSFLEYLVARHLAKNISENDASVFQLKLINWTTLGFLIEMERSFIQGSLVGISYDTPTLIEWFHSYPRKKWISTNAIDLLARLLPHDLFCKLRLSGTDLSNAMLNNVDLRGANLTGANLTGANLTGANLAGVKLNNAVLADTKLQRSNLREAQLGGANLEKADLGLADLSHADLRDARLSRAIFSYASLIGANLEGADLSEANLDGAYIKDAKGIPYQIRINIKPRRGTDHESLLH